MMAENVFHLHAWKGKLASSKQGYKKNMTNLMICLQNVSELGSRIRFNELSQTIEWNGVVLEEHHLVDIRIILEAHDYEANAKDLLPALMRHARDNAFHPIRDYILGLEWDGTRRLHRWLKECFGAPDNQFVEAVSRRTLISSVARAFRPGCKVDTVLVLEGPQGHKKSSGIKALFGAEFTLESIDLFRDHKRMVMNIMGKWVVELTEFVAALKEDENKVKGLISIEMDRVTLPYAKTATDHPRSVIFIGSYNPDDLGYLRDTTGNRRYWPILVSRVDIPLIQEARDQLWAEAYQAYRSGEQWWLTEDEEVLAASEVRDREEHDPWFDIMADKLTPYSSVSLAEALGLLGIPNERLGERKYQSRMAKVLKDLGFELRFPKDANRKTVRRWARKPPDE